MSCRRLVFAFHVCVCLLWGAPALPAQPAARPVVRGATVPGTAAFRDHFEIIKREASAADLYRLLYQLPKGGDIHHHLGLSFLADDLWEAATNATINKGNEFYTRLKVSACPSDVTLPLRFMNVQRSAYDQLPAVGDVPVSGYAQRQLAIRPAAPR